MPQLDFCWYYFITLFYGFVNGIVLDTFKLMHKSEGIVS